MRGIGLALALLHLAATPAAANPCPGDCNADAETSVAEVVDCVRIALAGAGREICPACDSGNDGSISIDELVAAVHKTLTDCRTELVEATTDVTSTTVEGLSTFRVLNFGLVGPGAALAAVGSRGGGAGQAPCIQCPSGGTLRTYRCTGTNEGSILEATLDSCSQGGVTRSGQIKLTMDDPRFCGRCVVVDGVNGRQELTAYAQTFEDGSKLEIPGTLTEEFGLSSRGCRQAPLPDRLSTFNGAVRVTDGNQTTTFEYRDLLSSVGSILNDDGLCATFMVQDGTTKVTKTGIQSFVQTADNLILSDSPRLDGSRDVTMDTPNGGSLTVDCLAGEIELTTVEPMRFDGDDPCAVAGLLQVSLLAQRATSVIRFTATGGLLFDFDLDGAFEAGAARCDASSVARCGTELPTF